LIEKVWAPAEGLITMMRPITAKYGNFIGAIPL
jgi:hypothetical protein